jgi:hypothetical protein
LIFLHKSGKAVEPFGPEALVVAEPVHRLLHRPCGQPASHGAAGFRPRDQAGIRQHVEMLHDRGQRHREWLRQIAHRNTVLPAEPRQQRAPGRVGKCGKSAVQCRIFILNHMV